MNSNETKTRQKLFIQDIDVRQTKKVRGRTHEGVRQRLTRVEERERNI